VLAIVITASLVAAATTTGCKKSPVASDDGRQLFANTCARCHGADGAGGTPSFAGGPAPRNFHDHAFHEARTDEQLRMVIVNGKGTAMPPFGTMFDDQQLRALVAYVRSLDGQPVAR